MDFLRWLSENSCLSIVLFAIFMRGLVDVAKEFRKMKIEFTEHKKTKEATRRDTPSPPSYPTKS